jgi:endonuclease/exonuclease/phosphatase family metal-dependent hydrolase
MDRLRIYVMSSRQGPSICVGTINLRHNADRWKERAPLLIEQLLTLDLDAIGMQEVHVPSDQGARIVAQVNARIGRGTTPYSLYQTNKTGLQGWREGIAVMTRLPVVEREWLDLRGGARVAQRVRLRLPLDATLDFYNTHLHHEHDAAELRREQALRLIDWLAKRSSVPQVLVGDLNAQPSDEPVRLIAEHLWSAYLAVHGREPDRTAPTPLREGWESVGGHVIDYIFVNDAVEVHEARVTFDKAPAADPRLYASDHYGLMAKVSPRPAS